MFWPNLILLIQIVFIAKLSKEANAVRYVSHKNCNNVRKGAIVTNPGNCSQYIICNGLRSTLGECPEGQYFNGEMLSCDKNPIQCAKKTTTAISNTYTSSTSTSSTSTTTIFTNNIMLVQPSTTIPPLRPICSALQHEHNVGHPHNCAYYYHCARGNLSLKRCPFGHGWDWRKQRCMPLARAACLSSHIIV